MPEPHWSGRIPSVDGGGGAGTLTELADVTGTPAPGKSPVYDDTSVAPLTRVTTQDDLEQILTRVAEVEWHQVGDPVEPVFLSGFRNLGDPWAPARFRLTLNNVVFVEGTVANDDASIAEATWIPVFQLPPECVPGVNMEFLAATNDNAVSKLVVWEDGLIVWCGYMGGALGPHDPVGRLSLNGIVFSVGGQTPVVDAALTDTFA